MTKTKKQLRAEAVERLRELYQPLPFETIDAMTGDKELFSPQDKIDALIYLLTDDDANDDLTPEKVVSGYEPFLTPLSNPNETGNGDDSREKLEADVRKIAEAYNMDTQRHGSERFSDELYHSIIHLLNRQRAIDDSICDECSSDFYELQEKHDKLEDEVGNLADERYRYKLQCERHEAKIAELQAQVYVLTAERDTLQGALDIAVQNESKLEAERVKLRSQICKLEDDLVRANDERDNWKANCDDWKKHARAAENACYETMLEREQYRKLFGMALDWAHEITILESSVDEGMA